MTESDEAAITEHIGQHRHPPGTRQPDTTAENRHNTIRKLSSPTL
jgi:hypothetical protein